MYVWVILTAADENEVTAPLWTFLPFLGTGTFTDRLFASRSAIGAAPFTHWLKVAVFVLVFAGALQALLLLMRLPPSSSVRA